MVVALALRTRLEGSLCLSARCGSRDQARSNNVEEALGGSSRGVSGKFCTADAFFRAPACIFFIVDGM